jgi:hypothetical protein
VNPPKLTVISSPLEIVASATMGVGATGSAWIVARAGGGTVVVVAGTVVVVAGTVVVTAGTVVVAAGTVVVAAGTVVVVVVVVVGVDQPSTSILETLVSSRSSGGLWEFLCLAITKIPDGATTVCVLLVALHVPRITVKVDVKEDPSDASLA